MSDLHVVRRGGGAGPTLVFSHALGLDHTMWTSVAEKFAETRPVLLYDQRGHGRSGGAPVDWTLDDLVEDAATLIRAHVEGPVVFVGLSMGGMVAQGLAVRHPGLLRGAVLAHTVAHYAEPGRQAWAHRIEAVRASGMAAVVDTVVARYLGEGFRARHPEVAAALRAQLLANDPDAYVASCRAIARVDWLAELKDVHCPVLVVAGRHDIGAPVGEAERIVERIPHARLEVLEHSAHLGPVEEPGAFFAAVDRFLQTAC